METSIAWAKAEDWAAHRPTITRLYAEEDRTLREVIEIMKRDHSFFATPKMYKTRLKRWKLSKNLRAVDVSTALQGYGTQPPAAGATSTVLIRGRAVDPAKLERYLKRRPTREDFIGLSAASGNDGNHRYQQYTRSSLNSLQHVVAPGPQRLKAPDTFSLPEEIMLLTRQLVAGSHDRGMWATDNHNQLIFSTDTLVKWDHQLALGRRLLFTRKFKHAFKVLDSAFSMLGQLLTNYEPAFIIYLVNNALDLSPDIGQRLLSYVAEMSRTKLSAHHPLAFTMERLSRAGVDQLRNYAWTILISYVETLERQFGKSQKNLPFVVYWLINDAFLDGLVGADECEARINSVIAQCQSLGQRTDILQAQTILVNILIKTERYQAAEALLNQIMEGNRVDDDIYNQEIWEQSLYQTFMMYKMKGTIEEAVKAGRAYIQFLSGSRGPSHADVIFAASRLRMLLEEHGISTEGEKLEEYTDPDWDVFCETLHIS